MINFPHLTVMKNDRATFTKFSAIACLGSAITTIGIHAFFQFDATTFEQRLMLFQNPLYILNRWWVIVHCLLVIFSMWGFFLVQNKKSKELVGLGFIFFVVFAITEIFRQLLVLFYLNGMRQHYLAAENEATKIFLTNSIENFGFFSNALFGLFIMAFALGNFFYGLSLAGEMGLGKTLSVLLLIWSLGGFLAFGNEFCELPWLSSFLTHYNLWYQPLMRGLFALWLWKSTQSFNKLATVRE